MQNENWLRRIVDGAGLTDELLPGVPVLEIAGDCRVLIERHEGVTGYSHEEICIKVSYGMVCIYGCGLELIKMTQNQLIVSGRINGIQLQRRGT